MRGELVPPRIALNVQEDIRKSILAIRKPSPRWLRRLRLVEVDVSRWGSDDRCVLGLLQQSFESPLAGCVLVLFGLELLGEALPPGLLVELEALDLGE